MPSSATKERLNLQVSKRRAQCECIDGVGPLMTAILEVEFHATAFTG